MKLELTKKPTETWREAVERTAKVFGMDRECLYQFDAEIEMGTPEDQAAWIALYDWDCIPFTA